MHDASGIGPATVAVTTPRSIAFPPVRDCIAPSAMLNPLPPVSTPRTMIVLSMYVRFQHVPQLGEFHPVIAGMPPMLGNPGRSPNVLKPKPGEEVGW